MGRSLVLVVLLMELALTAARARAQSPICYAAPGGNDLADGSYWAFAKADIMSCYDALPPTGGVIWLMESGVGEGVRACKPTDPPGCGIWIMGQGDPNYAHPPAGWRRRKTTVAIMGVAGGSATVLQRTPQVTISAGSGADTNHPAIWLSSVEAMTFENLSIAYPGVAVKLSIDSNGNRNGDGGSQQIEFKNVSAHINQSAGMGPAVDVGSNTFWVWFRDFSLSGNAAEFAYVAPDGLARSSGTVTVRTKAAHPFGVGERVGIVGAADATFDGTFTLTATTPTSFTYRQAGLNARSGGGAASSDKNNAVVMDPGSGTGANIYFQDGIVTSGGIKDYPGYSGIGLTVQNLNQEDGDAPAVWIANCVDPTFASVLNVQPADTVVSVPGLRVDCERSFAGEIVAQDTSVDGPATLAGVAGPSDRTVQPSLYSQAGVYGGHVIGQTDDARRGFGPVAARWPNLAKQVVTNWGNRACNGVTTPVSVTAPDGTASAGKATSTACFFSGTAPIGAGDWVIAGAWVRSESSGFVGGNPLTFQCMGCTMSPSAGYMHPTFGERGEWQWVWGLFNILSAPNLPQVYFYGSASSSLPADFFAPVLIDIPARTVTPNEAAEMALHLQSYRDDAAAGQVSLLRGEQFRADSIQVGDGPTISSGTGVPKGSASPGSIYLRRDGRAGSALYIYEGGAWKAQF
ncbi:MAG TPA: hypothetical protein VG206_23385 [Terriglobia bacterium]|nr:hypothetical protein [Terriglobia bacterium]